MVVLFSADKMYFYWFECRSDNGTHVSSELASIRRITQKDEAVLCRWTSYTATCRTVLKPTKFGLSGLNGSDFVAVPFRETVKKHYDAVACFSPLFYADRWQLLLTLIEVYRQLGMSMQVFYVQSTLAAIVDLMRVYESQGLIRLEPWASHIVDPSAPGLSYNPNVETEWRNQPAAHTDCLLQYKSAADFILFSDVDEVMFPVLGSTYAEEFANLLAQSGSAHSFLYNRYNAVYKTSFDPGAFSIKALLGSTKILNEWSSPKAVVIPSRVDTMWIHWPGHPSPRFKQVEISASANFWVHFRKWDGVDATSGRRPKWLRQQNEVQSSEPFRYQMGRLIPASRLEEIERGFRDFLSTSNASALYEALPRRMYYYRTLEQCYNGMFYARGDMPDFCPTPMRCNVSAVPNLRCSVAEIPYRWKALETDLIVHVPTTVGRFGQRYNGC